MAERTGRATIVLLMNTIAFAVCFAEWTMNGALVTFLVDQGVFQWNDGFDGLSQWLVAGTGALLQRTGLWTTCWMFFAALAIACLTWLHFVVRRITAREDAAKL